MPRQLSATDATASPPVVSHGTGGGALLDGRAIAEQLRAEIAARVAELDLEGEEARFQASRSTNFDVLRRQQALTEVRVRLLRARADGAQAAAALDAVTDDILARHGLAIRGHEVPR